jgi:hypothetical protein
MILLVHAFTVILAFAVLGMLLIALGAIRGKARENKELERLAAPTPATVIAIREAGQATK